MASVLVILQAVTGGKVKCGDVYSVSVAGIRGKPHLLAANAMGPLLCLWEQSSLELSWPERG